VAAEDRRCRVLAVANQKGGVGKTTTAINVSAALSAAGERVLLVDSDPQGNASTGLGLTPARRRKTLYDVLMEGLPASEAVMPTSLPGLDLLAAEADLAGVEVELGQTPRRSYRLRDALAPIRASGRYQRVLIDCPPALSLLTVNAMTAADALIVPLQCEFFALEGLTQLMRTVELVRGSLNPNLEIEGVALTMVDRRSNLAAQVAAEVRAHFGPKVFETVIPRNVRVSEAPSFGKPVLIYDMRCAGSQAYIHLARELLARERARAVGGAANSV